MTIFMVETFVVKLDKLGEFMAFHKKFKAWMEKRLDEYKEVKSHKVFSHMLGGNWGGHVVMWEVENLAGLEKFWGRSMQDKEWLTEFRPQLMALIVPGTYSINIWSPVQ
jgi:hypothetical protein